MKSLIISTMTEKMVVVSLPVRAQGVVIVPWVGSVHGGVEGIVSQLASLEPSVSDGGSCTDEADTEHTVVVDAAADIAVDDASAVVVAGTDNTADVVAADVVVVASVVADDERLAQIAQTQAVAAAYMAC